MRVVSRWRRGERGQREQPASAKLLRGNAQGRGPARSRGNKPLHCPHAARQLPQARRPRWGRPARLGPRGRPRTDPPHRGRAGTRPRHQKHTPALPLQMSRLRQLPPENLRRWHCRRRQHPPGQAQGARLRAPGPAGEPNVARAPGDSSGSTASSGCCRPLHLDSQHAVPQIYRVGGTGHAGSKACSDWEHPRGCGPRRPHRNLNDSSNRARACARAGAGAGAGAGNTYSQFPKPPMSTPSNNASSSATVQGACSEPWAATTGNPSAGDTA